MVDKYIGLNSGIHTEIPGTVVSAGVSEAGKIVALGADGKLDVSVLPPGLVDETDMLVAGEALSAGNFVYINSADGKAYKADASNIGKAAIGYVLSSAAMSATVRVYYEGSNTGVTGLTPGTRYFLSTTPGGVVTTPVAYGSGGRISQVLGTTVNSAKLNFEAGQVVIMAA